MEKYDYKKAMKKDIKEYIQSNPNVIHVDPLYNDDIAGAWSDVMWAEDEVTGNGAYYYDTEEKCSEYLAGNLDLCFEACEEYGIELKHLYEAAKLGYAARYLDCTLRCYLLYDCIVEVLEELK